MKLPRRSFFEFLASFSVAPFAIASNLPGTTMTAPSLPDTILPPVEWPDDVLMEWLTRPRLPVLEAEDHQTAVFVWAMIHRKKVEFLYLGGSTPGKKRVVSPGLIFRVEEHGPVYVAGFCHSRGEERVFRVDRVLPSAIVD